jgi:nitrite reductase/ring-hydroxylating ferredoxin subunit
MRTSKFIVAKTSDIAVNDRLIVEVAGREIGIYNVDGQFYAMLNRCPHLGGPLCRGGVVTEVFASEPGAVKGNQSKVFVTCPWHNWEFDIRTGQSYWNPIGLRARNYRVSVEHGDAVLRDLEEGTAERTPGPYQAEMIPVTIEDDYIVLSMRSAVASAAQS